MQIKQLWRLTQIRAIQGAENETGQSVVEYGLLLALAVMLAFAGLSLFGTTVFGLWATNLSSILAAL